MRLLFISESGHSLGMATHLTSEGHSVSLAIQQPFSIGVGVIDNTIRYTDGMEKEVLFSDGAPDMLIFDDDSMSNVADEFRQDNFRVLGASKWTNLINTNPSYSQNVIKAIGWDTDSVKVGTNLYITCWYNGTRSIATYASLVYRRFMSGGAGPDIAFAGMLGNFKQPVERVLESFLKPLDKFLRKAAHKGCFHIHALVDKDKFSVKDISASFNHPLALMAFENTSSSITSVLLKLFNETSTEIKFIAPWAGGALLSRPPFPYGASNSPADVKGIIPANLKHLWFTDINKEGSAWTTTGSTGVLGYVTTRGDYKEEIARRINRTAENLGIPDLQYRNDIGRNISKRLEELKTYGWLDYVDYAKS